MASQTSADKALHLLEVLSGEPRGMALRDLARLSGLPAATAHRLLLVLRRRGFVRQESEGGHYVLTLKKTQNSGITDLAGNWLAADVIEDFTVTAPP